MPPLTRRQRRRRRARQYAEAEIGLCYTRLRYYDPGLGRYLTPDPVGLLSG